MSNNDVHNRLFLMLIGLLWDETAAGLQKSSVALVAQHHLQNLFM